MCIRDRYHFHEWIKKGLEQEWDFEDLAEKIQERNPELIVISNELGYGVVPVSYTHLIMSFARGK